MRFYLALAAVVALLVATRTDILGGHAGAVGLAAVAVLAWLIWNVPPGGKSPAAAGRVVTGHGHGARKFIARHEGGHAVAAKAVGGRVTSAWMTDSEGAVSARIPNDPTSRVAFAAAGRYAVGSGRGCSDDDAAIRRILREVPSKQRGQVRRDGIRLARRITSSRSGEIKAYARKLESKGRL
jgi:hypothetical protein